MLDFVPFHIHQSFCKIFSRFYFHNCRWNFSFWFVVAADGGVHVLCAQATGLWRGIPLAVAVPRLVTQQHNQCSRQFTLPSTIPFIRIEHNSKFIFHCFEHFSSFLHTCPYLTWFDAFIHFLIFGIFSSSFICVCICQFLDIKWNRILFIFIRERWDFSFFRSDRNFHMKYVFVKCCMSVVTIQ